jgi:hypothetical protein
MKEPRRIIGLDLDGTIVNHTANKLSLAADFGYALEPWQTSSNVMGRFMAKGHYDALRERLYGEMTLSAPPMPGSLAAVARFGGDALVISARREDNRDVVMHWLEHNGFLEHLRPDRVHFVGRSLDKAAFLPGLGVTAYVDDQVKVLRSLPEGVARFLFDEHDAADRYETDVTMRIIRAWEDLAGEWGR